MYCIYYVKVRSFVFQVVPKAHITVVSLTEDKDWEEYISRFWLKGNGAIKNTLNTALHPYSHREAVSDAMHVKSTVTFIFMTSRDCPCVRKKKKASPYSKSSVQAAYYNARLHFIVRWPLAGVGMATGAKQGVMWHKGKRLRCFYCLFSIWISFTLKIINLNCVVFIAIIKTKSLKEELLLSKSMIFH